MILRRTVTVPDPLVRANVVQALAGAGGPAGVRSCVADGPDVIVAFDAETTAPELIDALIAVETTFVPERASRPEPIEQAAAVAARGLREPDLDATRIIETYLP